MKKTIWVAATALAAALFFGMFLFAQPSQQAVRVGFEITSVFPHENAPGHYEQADASALRNLAADGWELVSVTPFVYRNEEHNNGTMNGPKPVVTQVYPAYFFKRPRAYRF
jgi:hypothetical protein